MKVKRKIIKIDEEKCNGCSLCIPSCPEGALAIVETPKGPKARLVKENFCDGLGACLGDCPVDALKVVESEVEEYDEEGVIQHIKETAPEKLEKHLKHLKEHSDELPKAHHSKESPCGCPSAQMLSWDEIEKISKPLERVEVSSKLRQWPVQIKLVNPLAPYFSRPGGTDLLVAADCVPFAYGDFHQDFLKGKTVVVGCPKLDDIDYYIQKLADIFKTADIKSVETIIMEVPCCSGLNYATEEALKLSGKKIPHKNTIIGIKGDKKI